MRFTSIAALIVAVLAKRGDRKGDKKAGRYNEKNMEADELFKKWDTNKNGKVTKEEATKKYSKACVRMAKKSLKEADKEKPKSDRKNGKIADHENTKEAAKMCDQEFEEWWATVEKDDPKFFTKSEIVSHIDKNGPVTFQVDLVKYAGQKAE